VAFGRTPPPQAKKKKKKKVLYSEEIMIPRVTKRQQNRANAPSTTAKQYYKINVFFPFIDACLLQLNSRFADHAKAVYALSALIPAHTVRSTFAQIKPACHLYAAHLPGGERSWKQEFDRWKAYWLRQPEEDRCKRALDALDRALLLDSFPCISALLQIFCTLPVTTATGERSFSSLKYIKSYLRSTMGEERLNGLAHLFINRNIELDIERVIDDFGKGNRRLDFL
jgi:hypothetical protein